MRAELARPAKLQGEVAGPNDGHALIARPVFEQLAQGAAQLHVPPGLRKRWGEDIRIDGYNWQFRLRACRDDVAGNAVIHPQFIAEGEVETGIKSRAQEIRREFFVSFEEHAGQSELALLIVIVRVVVGSLA